MPLRVYAHMDFQGFGHGFGTIACPRLYIIVRLLYMFRHYSCFVEHNTDASNVDKPTLSLRCNGAPNVLPHQEGRAGVNVTACFAEL
jgi:hypothetical protein